MNQRIGKLRRDFRYLKRGVFPPDSIDEFTFGRNTEMAAVESHLNDVAGGPTRHIFVQGAYGCGKSHFLKAVEATALRRGFAVSWVTLDGHNHACNHPTRYFHSFLENLRVPNSPLRGLSSLVSLWLRGERADPVVTWAKQSSSWWPSVPILAYQHTLKEMGSACRPSAVIESRDIANRSGRLWFDTVSRRMQATAALLRAAGCRGVVSLFDELETVATLLSTVRQRFLCYQFLNMLIDGRKRSHCMFVFAATPDFGNKLELDRISKAIYAGEYPEGWRFIQKWCASSVESIFLRKLGRNDAVNLCRHIRCNHEEAFMWSMDGQFSDEFLHAFVGETERLNMSIREMVKAFVYLLEVAEQHRSADVEGSLTRLWSIETDDDSRSQHSG